MTEKIGVIGLGYVGLPVALAFAKRFAGTVGFDIHQARIDELKRDLDRTGETTPVVLKETSLICTSQIGDLAACTFFVVAVPTPVDIGHRPDLTALVRASETVGKVLKKGDVVVYESTVYPGATEEVCRPVLARVSGLEPGKDFCVGYSPERINPGDHTHTIEKVIKVVSGEDQPTSERVASVYAAIVEAGVYRATSIRVAEAAKVIENTQRDLNIALMNELAMVFDRMGIRTQDVLDAAGTKWNFLKFMPGLVGGHCIGVDPYYLTHKAEQLGYIPEVILAGRRINNNVSQFVAHKTLKLLAKRGQGQTSKPPRIGVLGVTFKENVPDLRNSKVPDLVDELVQFGAQVLVHDPMAAPSEAKHEYGLDLVPLQALSELDAMILAVPHRVFLEQETKSLLRPLLPQGIFIDLKSACQPSAVAPHHVYWSL